MNISLSVKKFGPLAAAGLSALILLTAGCASSIDQSPEAISPPPSSAPEATQADEPSPSPTPKFSADETKYLEAKEEELQDESPNELIRDGYDYCEHLDKYYSSDPMSAVSAFVETESMRDSAAAKSLCSEYAEAMTIAEQGFWNGTFKVVEEPSQEDLSNEIPPGTYRTLVPKGASGTTDCYWERTSADGTTLANDFVTLATDGVTVTIANGEGFISENCGAWLPA